MKTMRASKWFNEDARNKMLNHKIGLEQEAKALCVYIYNASPNFFCLHPRNGLCRRVLGQMCDEFLSRDTIVDENGKPVAGE